jgi:hypothetical protein
MEPFDSVLIYWHHMSSCRHPSQKFLSDTDNILSKCNGDSPLTLADARTRLPPPKSLASRMSGPAYKSACGHCRNHRTTAVCTRRVFRTRRAALPLVKTAGHVEQRAHREACTRVIDANLKSWRGHSTHCIGSLGKTLVSDTEAGERSLCT